MIVLIISIFFLINSKYVRVGESIANRAALKVGDGEQLIGQAFQQNAILSYNGFQYTTYYNADRHVCVARRKLPLGNWSEVILPYRTTSSDAHNIISMGISTGDGTIHLAYDHHDHPLHYCGSIIGLAKETDNSKWVASNFNATTSTLYSGVSISIVCYPRFISRPDGNLFFECRHGSSGSGDCHLRLYNATSHSWSNIGRYIQGRDNNPDFVNGYINRLDYDSKGRLHVSWVWRETPDAITNHDLSYAYSDDNGLSWYDYSGKKVAETDRIEPTDNGQRGKSLGRDISSLIVNPIKQHRGLINQESHSTDSKSKVHMLNSYILDSEPDNTNWANSRTKAYLHHQYQDSNGSWKIRLVKNKGTNVVSSVRSQIVLDSSDNAYVIANKAEVYTATPGKEYDDWELISNVDANRFACEPQVDHPLILSDGVLSFVYLGTDSRIYVIDYLLDNPTRPSGSGLHAEYFSDTSFNNKISEGDSDVVVKNVSGLKSVRWSGTVDIIYGEAYELYLYSDVPVSVTINGNVVLQEPELRESTIKLPTIASHKYHIVIEAQATPDSTVSLSWSSASTSKVKVPITSLYNKEL